MNRQPLALFVNGERHELLAEPHWTLLHVLRTHLGLSGTKENCLEAECGVCTVLLDGKAVNSCIVLARQCEGRSITTIEGLADPASDDRLHPAQRALLANHGLQCGFCTPGVTMTLAELADRSTHPSPEETCEELSGNLCRCTGYQGILAAAYDLLGHRHHIDKDDRP